MACPKERGHSSTSHLCYGEWGSSPMGYTSQQNLSMHPGPGSDGCTLGRWVYQIHSYIEHYFPGMQEFYLALSL